MSSHLEKSIQRQLFKTVSLICFARGQHFLTRKRSRAEPQLATLSLLRKEENLTNCVRLR